MDGSPREIASLHFLRLQILEASLMILFLQHHLFSLSGNTFGSIFKIDPEYDYYSPSLQLYFLVLSHHHLSPGLLQNLITGPSPFTLTLYFLFFTQFPSDPLKFSCSSAHYYWHFISLRVKVKSLSKGLPGLM